MGTYRRIKGTSVRTITAELRVTVQLASQRGEILISDLIILLKWSHWLMARMAEMVRSEVYSNYSGGFGLADKAPGQARNHAYRRACRAQFSTWFTLDLVWGSNIQGPGPIYFDYNIQGLGTRVTNFTASRAFLRIIKKKNQRFSSIVKHYLTFVLSLYIGMRSSEVSHLRRAHAIDSPDSFQGFKRSRSPERIGIVPCQLPSRRPPRWPPSSGAPGRDHGCSSPRRS